MTKTAAILLAGGRIKTKDRDAWQSLLPSDCDNRVLVDIAGKPMYRYVTDALQSAGLELVIAGDVPFDGPHVRVDAGASLVDTLLNGVSALPPDVEMVLVVTADIPFVTASDISAILASAPNADFVYTVIPMDVCRATFPDAKRTSLRTADGEFTGGNIVLINPEFVRNNEAVIRESFERRKDVLGLGKLLGPDVIVRLLLSRLFPGLLRISILEQAVSRLVGHASVRALIVNDAAIGTDIDSASDVMMARKVLGK
ncbi:MAG: NTP transferase domain-containing protein [Armatimonadota bacterium]